MLIFKYKRHVVCFGSFKVSILKLIFHLCVPLLHLINISIVCVSVKWIFIVLHFKFTGFMTIFILVCHEITTEQA